MCGEGALTDQTCQKWFAKFHAGDFSLEDAPRSGGPVEVDSDQIKTLIENKICVKPLLLYVAKVWSLFIIAA